MKKIRLRGQLTTRDRMIASTHTTSYAYDVMNRLVWSRDPKLQVTQFAYSPGSAHHS
jgi:hypothetical protein